MRAGVIVAVLTAVFFVAGATNAAAKGPLETAVMDPVTFEGPDADLAFARVAASGARYVRLTLVWSSVAPAGPAIPAGFNAADPADPRYTWSAFDRQVAFATRHGLQPIVSIFDAPQWAQDARDDERGYRNWLVDPTAVASFAHAAAVRYSGVFLALPRVRYWQAWNEPNLSVYYNPQYAFQDPVVRDQGFRLFDVAKPLSPGRYRDLVNGFADAVHGVLNDNVVIGGGLAPFSGGNVAVSGGNVAALRFMRLLFCLSPQLEPTCSDKVRLDVWSHHPYTSGSPTHKAELGDNVSLGDLPKMRRVLNAAVGSGHLVSNGPVRFWITEFSWDTNPPDPKGVPIDLQARWTSEALYRAWANGISLVTWFLLRDYPFPASPYQSGLWFNGGATIAGDKPKPTLTAFRFPFVAFRRTTGVVVWGRTATSAAATVTISQRAGRWKKVASLQADGTGVFTATVRATGDGPLRASVGGAASLPFSLQVPPDHFYYPFGS